MKLEDGSIESVDREAMVAKYRNDLPFPNRQRTLTDDPARG